MEKVLTTGRRKTSVARVFVEQGAGGKGTIQINKRSFENYFPVDILRMIVLEPFKICELEAGDYNIKVNVNGGGISGQAEALRLGISRALVEFDAENKPPLKKKGLMTRDPRMVERKKYGKAKARKSFQFSKR